MLLQWDDFLQSDLTHWGSSKLCPGLGAVIKSISGYKVLLLCHHQIYSAR